MVTSFFEVEYLLFKKMQRLLLVSWKKHSVRRKRWALAAVRRSQKLSPTPQTPFAGARDGQNLISWRQSLPSHTDPVWWRSMHAISSYRGNKPTHPRTPTNIHTEKQTGPITIFCAAA